ncbi:MAG: YdeI/OmpD-associated family protein [Bacteroidetes bacterium]|nr:YdeI/OmpD-associated family protein [Bacteroidota bacterium]
MKNPDKRIDGYISKSADFAKPILTHLRKLIHKTCPEVTETIKWGFPHFDYKNEMMCSMASFKQHCAFTFWKASLMKDYDKVFKGMNKSAMGHFGKIKDLKDLPSDKIISDYIKEAMSLNDEGIKLKIKKAPADKKLSVPAVLKTALIKNPEARKVFESMSTSHKKEYAEWIDEAKTDATKEKRLKQTIEWLCEGKSKNWKYTK